MKLSKIRTLLSGIVSIFFFAGLITLFLKSLTPSNNAQILNARFPEFMLSDLRQIGQLVTQQELKGKAAVVHVWATWCGVCIKEHEEWLTIKKNRPFLLVSVVYRDDAVRVARLLQEKGDPYDYVLNDFNGKLGLDLGIIGTPETFVVDPNGVIRYHHLGAIDAKTFEKDIIPVINKFTLVG